MTRTSPTGNEAAGVATVPSHRRSRDNVRDRACVIPAASAAARHSRRKLGLPWAFLGLASFLTFAGSGIARGAEPVLSLPVDCIPGTSCFVQNYVAHGHAASPHDFQCGTRTYPGHSGTDFRLADYAAMRAGVRVLAAAPGRVIRLRDNVPDGELIAAGREAVRGHECGNGVVIAHGDGWETQYCHMRAHRFSVRIGQEVAAGTPLGEIGLSGLTEYPHLHLTLRHAGKVVDPFAADAPAGSCGGGHVLWQPGLREPLGYRASDVLNLGIGTRPLAARDVDAGVPVATRESGALFAYARIIGLQSGDIGRLTLKAPDGETLATYAAPPLDRAKAQQLLYAGARLKAASWPVGTYMVEIEILRKGQPVLRRKEGVAIR